MAEDATAVLPSSDPVHRVSLHALLDSHGTCQKAQCLQSQSCTVASMRVSHIISWLPSEFQWPSFGVHKITLWIWIILLLHSMG